MKRTLLTAAELQAHPPESIDLDAVILAPSALVLAERLGIPMLRGGKPLIGGAAGSSKSGGPGPGDYRLVRPEFYPTGTIPRHGNPTFAPQEPIRGSKAWQAQQGGELAALRDTVRAKLGPDASLQAVDDGVQAILDHLRKQQMVHTKPTYVGGGGYSYEGADGQIHVIFPNRAKTYIVRIENGQARINEVLE